MRSQEIQLTKDAFTQLYVYQIIWQSTPGFSLQQSGEPTNKMTLTTPEPHHGLNYSHARDIGVFNFYSGPTFALLCYFSAPKPQHMLSPVLRGGQTLAFNPVRSHLNHFLSGQRRNRFFTPKIAKVWLNLGRQCCICNGFTDVPARIIKEFSFKIPNIEAY